MEYPLLSGFCKEEKLIEKEENLTQYLAASDSTIRNNLHYVD